jgi:large-conductance mechanosensitive channel
VKGTIVTAYLIDIMTLMISGAGFLFWFLTQRMLKRRQVELGVFLEKVIVFSIILINVLFLLIYFFSESYISTNMYHIRKCRDDFNEDSKH